MQVQPECIICLFRLALRAAQVATSDQRLHREVLNRLAQEIPQIPAAAISPQIGRRVQRIVHDVTGVARLQRRIRPCVRMSLGIVPSEGSVAGRRLEL